MIKVVAKAIYKTEGVEKAIELLSELVEESRKEEGCIKYEMYQDVKDETILTMIEEWESEEDLKKHMEESHYLRIIPKVRELRAGTGDIGIYKKLK
jgi:quinol monooxygenase YgiN